MRCSRFHKGKQCEREARYTVPVMGYDFQVCSWHKFIQPLSQFWINIQLKFELWEFDRIHWSLIEDMDFIRRD